MNCDPPTIPGGGGGSDGDDEEDDGDNAIGNEYIPPTPHDHFYGHYGFNMDYLFDPYRGTDIDSFTLLREAAWILYGGNLMQMAIEACAMDYCNNPVGGYDILKGDTKIALGSYLSTQQSDLPTQLFIKEVGAASYAINGMNYEPAWVSALQQIRPHELVLAKRKFIEIYNSDPEIYQAIEEGASAVGP